MSRRSRLRAEAARMEAPRPVIPRYRVVLWITVLVIALFYALWYGNPREVKTLNEQARQELGGTYVELEDGVTHFDVEGPYDGPLFILVHGGTLGMFVWDEQVQALTSAGFEVLRYDAFGRGYSDRPDTDYTLAFWVKQLAEMVDRFSNGKPVHLAGVSVGALVAADYAARHPDRVGSLTLISPVVRGVPSSRGIPAALARVPGLGEVTMHMFGMNLLVRRARAMLTSLPRGGARMERLFLDQISYRGYERAILSMLRGDILRDQRGVYERLGRTKVPVQALWGRDDREISKQDMAFLRRAVPRVAFRAVPGAGHALLVQRGPLVSEAMIEFHKGHGQVAGKAP